MSTGYIGYIASPSFISRLSCARRYARSARGGYKAGVVEEDMASDMGSGGREREASWQVGGGLAGTGVRADMIVRAKRADS